MVSILMNLIHIDYDPGMDDYDVGPDTQFWADQPTESPDVQDQTQIDTQNDQCKNTLSYVF